MSSACILFISSFPFCLPVFIRNKIFQTGIPHPSIIKTSLPVCQIYHLLNEKGEKEKKERKLASYVVQESRFDKTDSPLTLQVDSVEVDLNRDPDEDEFGEHLFSPDVFDISDDFGNHEVLSRVGDEYKVETNSLSGCLLLFSVPMGMK